MNDIFNEPGTFPPLFLKLNNTRSRRAQWKNKFIHRHTTSNCQLCDFFSSLVNVD